jgi:hypothetical protein
LYTLIDFSVEGTAIAVNNTTATVTLATGSGPTDCRGVAIRGRMVFDGGTVTDPFGAIPVRTFSFFMSLDTSFVATWYPYVYLAGSSLNFRYLGDNRLRLYDGTTDLGVAIPYNASQWVFVTVAVDAYYSNTLRVWVEGQLVYDDEPDTFAASATLINHDHSTGFGTKCWVAGLNSFTSSARGKVGGTVAVGDTLTGDVSGETLDVFFVYAVDGNRFAFGRSGSVNPAFSQGENLVGPSGQVGNAFIEYGDGTVDTEAQWLYVAPVTGQDGTQQWTPSAGNNWQCVDEFPVSTSDYVSGVGGEVDVYTMSAGASDANAASQIKGIGVIVGGYSNGDVFYGVGLKSGGAGYVTTLGTCFAFPASPTFGLRENNFMFDLAGTAWGTPANFVANLALGLVNGA